MERVRFDVLYIKVIGAG